MQTQWMDQKLKRKAVLVGALVLVAMFRLGKVASSSGLEPETLQEKLVIETTNGRTLEQEVTRTPGSQAMPLTEKQLLGKITECSCSVNKAKDFLKAANEMPFRNFSLF